MGQSEGKVSKVATEEPLDNDPGLPPLSLLPCLANLRSAPAALDPEVRLGSYFAFLHGVKLLDPHYDFISAA